MIPFIARIAWRCESGLHSWHWFDVHVTISFTGTKVENVHVDAVVLLARNQWRSAAADYLGDKEMPAGLDLKGRELTHRHRRWPDGMRRELAAMAADAWWQEGQGQG